MSEDITKMPLKELMEYAGALEKLCNYYEKQLIPLYGGPTTYGKDSINQINIQNKLTKAKSYLSQVLCVIENMVYLGLDTYHPVDVTEKKILKKEPAKPRKPRATKTTKKTRNNAEKNILKD